MAEIKDKFIILNKLKFSESDLIIHALNPQGAKVSFIAKGALRSKKRFGGGVLEPSHFVQMTYKSASQEGQLAVLLEAQIINDFKGIRSSYEKIELALHFLDCVHRVSQEGDLHSEFLFNMLGHALKAIEVCEDESLLCVHFYLKFMQQQGVVQLEPWMTPFLRTPLAQSNSISEFKEKADLELPHLRSIILHYLKNATL